MDDDEDIRTFTKLTLEVVGGYTVIQCASGYEAIEQAAEAKPDLILLDVMMPGLDGEETFVKLREVEGLKSLPIVFATAKVHEESVKRLLSVGAAGVIAKPFDPLELPRTLESLWKRAQRETR